VRPQDHAERPRSCTRCRRETSVTHPVVQLAGAWRNGRITAGLNQGNGVARVVQHATAAAGGSNRLLAPDTARCGRPRVWSKNPDGRRATRPGDARARGDDRTQRRPGAGVEVATRALLLVHPDLVPQECARPYFRPEGICRSPSRGDSGNQLEPAARARVWRDAGQLAVAPAPGTASQAGWVLSEGAGLRGGLARLGLRYGFCQFCQARNLARGWFSARG
jgi:hypothetical protein